MESAGVGYGIGGWRKPLLENSTVFSFFFYISFFSFLLDNIDQLRISISFFFSRIHGSVAHCGYV